MSPAGSSKPHQEFHVTAFAPDFGRHIGSAEKGLAAYLETRFLDDTIAIAPQARLATSPGVQKLMGGLIGKFWVDPLKFAVHG